MTNFDADMCLVKIKPEFCQLLVVGEPGTEPCQVGSSSGQISPPTAVVICGALTFYSMKKQWKPSCWPGSWVVLPR